MGVRKKTLFIFIVCFIFIKTFGYASTSSLTQIKKHIRQVQKEFNVPGIAVAIVKDGKTVLLQGFGVCKIGENQPVDEETLFGIASNTKAFTASALAILVDEGKIEWDDRVINYIPDFQMYDPYVTREFRIRDLLTHRSGLGLGAGDLMFFPPTTFTRKEIIKSIRFLKPVSSFRSKFDYDNLLYMVAGEIIPKVTGKTWETFIKDRIFKPLGMKKSLTGILRLHVIPNVAKPHVPLKGKLIPVSYKSNFSETNSMGPAGSIISNVKEMAVWVSTLLNRGVIPQRKTKLFSKKQCREMWTPQTILPNRNFDGLNSNFSLYGLGFGLQDYRGKKIVTHTGGLLGMVSKVTLVPESNLGIVVLTNQQSGAAFYAITNKILDHYLHVKGKNWIQFFKKKVSAYRQKAEGTIKKLEKNRVRNTKPSMELSKYTGTFCDDWRSEVYISMKNGKLRMRFSRTTQLTGVLEHWQYDTFIARWDDRTLEADSFVTFQLAHDGSIEQVKMKAVSPLTDFSFDFHDLLLKPVKKR